MKQHEWRQCLQKTLTDTQVHTWWQCWRCLLVARTTDDRDSQDQWGCEA